MGILDWLIDHTPALRCSNAEVVGRIVTKRFVKDAGFGDCSMLIEYEFRDTSGQMQVGRHVGTESNYYDVKVGDSIAIRYLAGCPTTNAPKDALGIIKPVAKDAS